MKDWGRLGVLLGVLDPELGRVLAAWPSLTTRRRGALAALVGK